MDAVAALAGRVDRCFEAGALATGCELTIAPCGPDYADLRADQDLLQRWVDNVTALGREFPDLPNGVGGAATDMGYVSHVVPTIHPILGLDCLPAVKAVLDGAIGMAWTAIDVSVRTS